MTLEIILYSILAINWLGIVFWLFLLYGIIKPKEKEVFYKQPSIFINGEIREWHDALAQIAQMEYIVNKSIRSDLIYFDYKTRRYEIKKEL